MIGIRTVIAHLCGNFLNAASATGYRLPVILAVITHFARAYAHETKEGVPPTAKQIISARYFTLSFWRLMGTATRRSSVSVTGSLLFKMPTEIP